MLPDFNINDRECKQESTACTNTLECNAVKGAGWWGKATITYTVNGSSCLSDSELSTALWNQSLPSSVSNLKKDDSGCEYRPAGSNCTWTAAGTKDVGINCYAPTGGYDDSYHWEVYNLNGQQVSIYGHDHFDDTVITEMGYAMPPNGEKLGSTCDTSFQPDKPIFGGVKVETGSADFFCGPGQTINKNWKLKILIMTCQCRSN